MKFTFNNDTKKGWRLLSIPFIFSLLLLAAPLTMMFLLSFWTQDYLTLDKTFTFKNYIEAVTQPVYKLLGGKVQEKIQAYANGWYTVERNPDSFSLAASKVVAKGYKALKFDPIDFKPFFLIQKAGSIIYEIR